MPVPSATLACGCATIFTFAQSGGESSMLRVFGWSLVLIVLLVGGFFAIARLRQWMKEDDSDVGGDVPATGFTLSDLRQLHKQGKMSDAEFERLKGMILGSARAMTEKMPNPLERGGARSDRKGPPGPVRPA
jgi:hypothetical protein